MLYASFLMSLEARKKKHTVRYVMQIGAITLLSILQTVTEHHNSRSTQTYGTAVLDVANVLCEYEL